MQALTAGQIIDEVRGQVHDESEARWSSTILYRYIFDAEKIVAREHPESQYVTEVTNTDPALLDDAADTLTVGDDWRSAIIAYVCGSLLGEDADDSHNAKRSQEYFAAFWREVNRR